VSLVLVLGRGEGVHVCPIVSMGRGDKVFIRERVEERLWSKIAHVPGEGGRRRRYPGHGEGRPRSCCISMS
jgi:hypothetical protein